MPSSWEKVEVAPRCRDWTVRRLPCIHETRLRPSRTALDASEEFVGGLVGRALRHKATLEGRFQDALARLRGKFRVVFTRTSIASGGGHLAEFRPRCSRWFVSALTTGATQPPLARCGRLPGNPSAEGCCRCKVDCMSMKSRGGTEEERNLVIGCKCVKRGRKPPPDHSNQ